MTPRDLSTLSKVLGAACDAAEARLAALRREEAELRRQIGALDSARRRRAAEAQATDVTLRAGVDLRWEGWVEQRATALVGELAQLLARIEIARDELSRALGRRTAAEALVDQARAAAARRRLGAEERGW